MAGIENSGGSGCPGGRDNRNDNNNVGRRKCGGWRRQAGRVSRKVKAKEMSWKKARRIDSRADQAEQNGERSEAAKVVETTTGGLVRRGQANRCPER